MFYFFLPFMYRPYESVLPLFEPPANTSGCGSELPNLFTAAFVFLCSYEVAKEAECRLLIDHPPSFAL